MNLFFRLLTLLLMRRLRPRRISYLDEAVRAHRVWLTDQDAFMHMNNSRYNSLCDLSSLDLMMRAGLLGPLRKAGLAPVIVYRGITIHRMLKFPDAYEVGTRIVAWTGAYICFRHEFRRGNRLCAEGYSLGRAVGEREDKPDVQTLIARLDLKDTPESPPVPEICRLQIDLIEAARAARRAERAGTAGPAPEPPAG